MSKKEKDNKLTSDCEMLRKMVEERSAELTRAYRELYQETTRRWQLEKEINKYRDSFNKRVKGLTDKLENALEDDKELKGYLTICSACKKILDENDQWNRVEKYIENHSEVTFTHSICPSCYKRLYPQLHDNQEDAVSPDSQE